MRMNKTKSCYPTDRKCSVIKERILRHKIYAKYKKDSPVSVCAIKSDSFPVIQLFDFVIQFRLLWNYCEIIIVLYLARN